MKCENRFCEVTSWWNWHYIKNQLSPHFFYYPAKLMLEKGFDVEVLTKLYPERSESRFEVNDGIKVRRFPQNPAKFFICLLKHMLKNNYSLVHLHTVGFLEDFIPWITSRIKKVPMVFTSHDPGLPGLENGKDIKALIYKKSLKVKDFSTVFVAFTEWQANLYRKWGLKNVKVIPHAIDPAVFNIQINYEIAEKYGLMENNILCVGQIDPRKGQHILVEIMPKILMDRPKTKLLLVGRVFNENQRIYLKNIESKIERMNLKKNVAFLRDVPKDDLIQLYLLSDVFAFPTDREIFGLVLLEAMAAGLPIISTDRPYIKEILQEGKAGILVKRKEKEFEKGIIALLNDDNLRNRLSKEGRRAIKEKYHLDKIIEKHWELYKSLIHARSNL